MSMRRALPIAFAALTLLVAACGGGGSKASSGAPAAPPPGGISEAYLLRHPHQALNATHTVLLDLEADAAMSPDTGTIEGVDEVPYYFARPTRLTLAVDDSFAAAPTLTLLNEMGATVMQVGGAPRAQTATVSGALTLQVRHPRAGVPGAAPQPVFLRPTIGGADGPNPADVERLEAGEDCVGCDLRGLVMEGFLELRNLDLSTSDFTGASLSSGVFFYADTMTGVIFDHASFDSVLFGSSVLTGASFKGARFLPAAGATCQGPSCRTHKDLEPSGCCVIHCNTTFANGLTPMALDRADFSGATFASACLGTATLQGASFAGATFDYASSASADFAGSDLRGAVFDGTDVMGRDASGEPAADGAPASFAGATLSDATTGATFNGVDLTGIDFAGTDLRQASFANSTLTGTTNFAGANFSGSNFDGIDLSRVDLSGATLSSTTSFAGATLSDGTAHGVNLACLPSGTGGCQFPQRTTQFKGVDLSYANLNGAGLEEADLSGTILDNAELIGARLNLASLKNASLRGLVAGVQPGSSGQVTQLGGAYMVNADLTDADLRSADLSGAHLYGSAQLVRTQLDAADLSNAICAGAAFSGSLTDTVFDNAVLVNATFNGADLTNAKLDTAYLQGADFSSASSVLGATLRNAAVATAPGTWTFTEQNGQPFSFEYGATALGAFTTDATVICPDNANGPCDTAASLVPVENGPFPPQPPCVPSYEFCYENCLDPPVFDVKPPQCGG
ncbi:pentapeptide repeat-containing protein [bacterium]|nr:pentapeptide repeat-containing protein [bacterium]